MAHAIFRTAAGRRYEVDFDEAAMSFEILLGDTYAELVIEGREGTVPSKRRLALLSVPRPVFDAAARRAGSERVGGAVLRPDSA